MKSIVFVEFGDLNVELGNINVDLFVSFESSCKFSPTF